MRFTLPMIITVSLLADACGSVVIQNTTFGGIQGFTVEPNTPWYDDNGDFAGVVRQERGWTFVLVEHAGHEVPEFNPEAVRLVQQIFLMNHFAYALVSFCYRDLSCSESSSLEVIRQD